MLLNFGDTVLQFVSVVDVNVSVQRLVALLSLVVLYHCAEQILHASARFEYRRHHRNTEKGAQLLEVDVVATVLHLVVHIQCAHHRYVHINELRC